MIKIEIPEIYCGMVLTNADPGRAFNDCIWKRITSNCAPDLAYAYPIWSTNDCYWMVLE